MVSFLPFVVHFQSPAAHTYTGSLQTDEEREKVRQSYSGTKKAGDHFRWSPASGIGSVIPRRSGHRERIMINAPQRTFEFRTKLDNWYHAVTG
jgi:hypothetical protein